ncbi:MAG: aminotransferase class I/II-fold pyridoxal phosphate-dependent enzyme [Gemmatimonadota bacterium]|nr:aminotransferase class I/II-fold pyridoxal phosphate-dependent enzyme [Gemmatimonadota bacterium]
MKRIYISPPHMGTDERDLLLDAFDSNWIAPAGPHLDALEREFASRIGVAHAVAVSSGTAGLHLALVLLGVERGDEIVTSSLTFAATLNAIRYVGGVPVLIDSDRRTWTLDPELLAEELDHGARRGKLPKAVIAVDLYGQCADYDRIEQACSRYDVPLIADASESLGATYRGRPAGSQGSMGVFSFNGNKIITTGGGGMLVSDRKDWIERARHLSMHARDPAPHYEHSCVGYSYRMSNLLAAVGRGQLRVLSDHVDRRRRNNDLYRRELAGLPGISFMPEAPYGRATFWLTAVTIDPAAFGNDREALRVRLEEDDIESRPLLKPMHLQQAFRECRIRGGAVSAELFDGGLCLPSGSDLKTSDLNRVVATIRSLAPADAGFGGSEPCKNPNVA